MRLRACTGTGTGLREQRFDDLHHGRIVALIVADGVRDHLGPVDLDRTSRVDGERDRRADLGGLEKCGSPQLSLRKLARTGLALGSVMASFVSWSLVWETDVPPMVTEL